MTSRGRLRLFAAALCSVLALILASSPACWAHRPHDDVTSLALSPDYSRDRMVYIIVRGNLFLSNNRGESWRRITWGLDGSAGISDIAAAPSDPRILYLATHGSGVYRSGDGGYSWSRTGSEISTARILSIAVSPSSSDLVLASDEGDGRLYRSEDGGAHWDTVMSEDRVTAVSFLTPDGKEAAAGTEFGGLFQSSDGGKTWNKIFSLEEAGKITAIAPSPPYSKDSIYFIGTEKKGVFRRMPGKRLAGPMGGLSGKYIMDVAVSPRFADDHTVFALTWFEGLYRSSDGGQTWELSADGLICDPQADTPEFRVAHYDDIEVSDNFGKDRTVFVGGFNGLFYSDDGGLRWRELESFSSRVITALAVSPNYKNDRTVVAAMYDSGELHLSRNGGRNWQPMDAGMEEVTEKVVNGRLVCAFEEPRFFDVAFSPAYAADRCIFATSLWMKFFRSSNGGRSWKPVYLASARSETLRGFTIAVSPDFAHDGMIYIATQYGIILLSKNRGRSFSYLSKVGNRGQNTDVPLVISPGFASDRTLYADGREGIVCSKDAGRTWVTVLDRRRFSITAPIQIALSPGYSSDGTVFAAAASRLFKTEDRGETWREMGIRKGAPGGAIEALSVSPDYPRDRTVLISVAGRGLFESRDGGVRFEPLAVPFSRSNHALARLGGPPSASPPIHFSPAYREDRTLFGFGSARPEIFKSSDAGKSWETLTIPFGKRYTLLSRLRIIRLFLQTHPYTAYIVLVLSAFAIGAGFRYLRIESFLPVPPLILQAVVTLICLVLGIVLLWIQNPLL